MDDTLSVGGTTTIEPAVTETPEQSTGTEQAGAENQSTDGGGEQSQAESPQQQAVQGRRRWSIQDEVKELRAQRRELREKLATLETLPDQLAQLREELNRRAQPGPVKTPANFWQDPEGRLQALRDEMKEAVAEQNQTLLQAFHRTREEEHALAEQRQRAESAAEFIRSQQGYDPSDEEDIIEIINEIPKNTRENTDPQMLAEYAWMKLSKQRGIGDRGLQKRQAAGIQGQPPGVGFGRKTWNRAEFEQAVDLVEQKMRLTPNDPKMNELFDELMAAHKEGRVK